MLKAIALACNIALLAGSVQAAPAERLDEASVRAAENRWSEAFITGDAAALDALLAPTYVSVGGNGKPRPKAEIIAIARTYAASHPGLHATPLARSSTVEIIGATALVKHDAATELSIDLFAFQSGHWQARYSQHTLIAPPT